MNPYAAAQQKSAYSRRKSKLTTSLHYCVVFSIVVMVPAPARAQDVQYFNSDGGKTSDYETAKQSWRTPEYLANWGLAMHGFDAAYANGATGQGVVLGQFDSSLFASHPEMSGIQLNTFNGWTEALNGEWKDKEVEWHGQHVAGLAVARKDGKGMHGGSFGSTVYFSAQPWLDGWDNPYDYRKPGPDFINHSYGTDLPNYRKPIFKDGKSIGLAASNFSDLHLQGHVDEITKSSLYGTVNVTAAGNDRLYAATKRALNKYDARPRMFRGISVSGSMASIAAAMADDPWIKYGLTETDWIGYYPDYKKLSDEDWQKLEKNVAVAVMLNGTSEISSYSALCGISKYSCIGTAGGLLAEPHQDYKIELPDMPLDVEYYVPGPDGISYLDKRLTGEIWASQYRMLSLATTGEAPAGTSNADISGKLRPIYKMAPGTSMASPMLMAGLGVTKSRFPYMENWQVRDTVYTTARDIGAKGIDRVYGWGEMDLAAAMGGPRKLFALRRDYFAKLRNFEIAQADIYDQVVAEADNFATEAYELKVQMNEKEIAAVAADKSALDSAATQAASDASAALAKQLRTEIAELAPKEAAARKRAYELELTRVQPNLPGDTQEAAFEYIDYKVNIPGEINRECSTEACIADVWTNDIEGPGGLTKLGRGALVLTGANSYRGDTIINGGLLAVDGSLTSTVAVNNGGTLGGSGVVARLAVHGGGMVSPGNSIGTLHVAGDAGFFKQSGLMIQVAPDGRSDRLNVAGKAILLGGVVTVATENGTGTLSPAETLALLDKSYTILTTASGVAGRFDAATPNYYFIGASLAYTSEDVSVSLGRNNVAFADVGQTKNQKAAASGIESLGQGDGLYDRIAVSTLSENLPAGFDALSGEMHASLKGVLAVDGKFVRDAVSNRIHAAFGDGAAGGPRVRGLAYGSEAKKGGEAFSAVEPSAVTAAFWGETYGSWSHANGNGNASALSRNAGGFITGFDGAIADTWRLGLLAGYGSTSVHADHGRASADAYQVGVYGGTKFDALTLSFGTSLAHHEINTRRQVIFGDISESDTADYSAKAVQVFGEASYHIDTSYAALEPFAGLSYTRLKTDDFTETGGIAALSGRSDTTEITTATLGLRASHRVSLGETTMLTARGMVGWWHTFGDTTPAASLAFRGGNAFSIEGLPVASDTALVKAGFDIDFGEATTVSLSYNGQFSSRNHDNAVKANLTVRF